MYELQGAAGSPYHASWHDAWRLVTSAADRGVADAAAAFARLSDGAGAAEGQRRVAAHVAVRLRRAAAAGAPYGRVVRLRHVHDMHDVARQQPAGDTPIASRRQSAGAPHRQQSRSPPLVRPLQAAAAGAGTGAHTPAERLTVESASSAAGDSDARGDDGAGGGGGATEP